MTINKDEAIKTCRAALKEIRDYEGCEAAPGWLGAYNIALEALAATSHITPDAADPSTVPCQQCGATGWHVCRGKASPAIAPEASELTATDERDAFEAWAKREGHTNFMRMAGDPEQYDDLILRAMFKAYRAAIAMHQSVSNRGEVAKPESKPKLVGWRTADFLYETSDKEMALNWQGNIEVLPIFEGDPHTALVAAAEPVPTAYEQCTHPDCGRFQDGAGWSCRAMRDNACARPIATKPAASEAERELGRLRQAFHINMIRAYPDKSHAEISAEIDRACGGVASEAAGLVLYARQFDLEVSNKQAIITASLSPSGEWAVPFLAAPPAPTDAGVRGKTERDGWESAAKALAERAAGHHRNRNFDLKDECLQCASMLHDMKPALKSSPQAPKQEGSVS